MVFVHSLSFSLSLFPSKMRLHSSKYAKFIGEKWKCLLYNPQTMKMRSQSWLVKSASRQSLYVGWNVFFFNICAIFIFTCISFQFSNYICMITWEIFTPTIKKMRMATIKSVVFHWNQHTANVHQQLQHNQFVYVQILQCTRIRNLKFKWNETRLAE